MAREILMICNLLKFNAILLPKMACLEHFVAKWNLCVSIDVHSKMPLSKREWVPFKEMFLRVFEFG